MTRPEAIAALEARAVELGANELYLDGLRETMAANETSVLGGLVEADLLLVESYFWEPSYFRAGFHDEQVRTARELLKGALA